MSNNRRDCLRNTFSGCTWLASCKLWTML